MTQVAVQVKPMPIETLNELIKLYQNTLQLESILKATESIQELLGGLPDEGPGLEDGEVAKVHSLQTEAFDTATSLFVKTHMAVARVLNQYLKDNGIEQGMTLVDSDENSFKFSQMDVYGQVYSTGSHNAAHTVELWLGDDEVRVSFYLAEGATLTVAQ